MKPGLTFKYPVPDFMQFQTPELQSIVDRLRTTDFIITSAGKVDLPDWLSKTQITIANSTYQMGIGGLHSTEANRALHSDQDFVLTDGDVKSQYPSIILMLGLYPLALGPEFLIAYREIYEERLAAKARAKVIKKEIAALETQLKAIENDE